MASGCARCELQRWTCFHLFLPHDILSNTLSSFYSTTQPDNVVEQQENDAATTDTASPMIEDETEDA